MDNTQFFPMLFQIDGGKQYRGFSKGERWNGWEMPYFTFDVAQQYAHDHNEATFREKLVYDQASDSFIYQDDTYPKHEWDRFEAITIGAQKFYALGAGSWIWDGERITE